MVVSLWCIGRERATLPLLQTRRKVEHEAENVSADRGKISALSNGKYQPGYGHIKRAETPISENAVGRNRVHVLQI